MTNATLRGKPDAGNPRRWSLLYMVVVVGSLVQTAFAAEAFLEAKGGQCVPINYYPNAQTRCELDFQFTATGKQQAMLGSWYTTGGANLGFWINGSGVNGNFETHLGGKWSGGMSACDTERRQVTVDVPNRKAQLRKGSSVSSNKTFSSPDTTVAKTPLCLFAHYANVNLSAAQNCAKAKFYGLKVYESDVLVHDYIPALKNGVAGVYDRETGAFFNEFKNGLSYGGDIIDVTDDEAYVSSPIGGVSVDTGYTPNANTCIEADFSFLAKNGSAQQFVLEAGTQTGSSLFTRVYVNGSGGLSWCYSDNKNDYKTFATNSVQVYCETNKRIRAVLDSYGDKRILATCGVTNACEALGTSRVKSAPSTLRLFSNTDGTGNFAKMRIYGFKIYEKGVLLHDYRPMKSFGKGVLKDSISGKTIFSNTATNLCFGGVVKEEPYIESTRGDNQRVELDYYPNAKTVIEVDFEPVLFDSNNDFFSKRVVFGTSLKNADGTGFGMWFNANKNREFRTHRAWSGGGFGWPGKYRQTAVIDNPNHVVAMCKGGNALAKSIDMSAKSGYVNPAPTSSNPLSLFGDIIAEDTSPSWVRIFNVVIREDGEIVRRYVPAVEGGVAGFRDVVTDKFFGDVSGSSAALVASGDYDGAPADNGDSFIESDGTQAVLTDYLPTAQTRAELNFAMTDIAQDNELFGRDAEPFWMIYVNYTSSWAFLGHSKWTTVFPAVADLARHTAIIDRVAWKASVVTGTTTNSANLETVSSASTNLPLAVFARSEPNGTFYGPSKMRVYSLRFYEGDTLTREFLPYQSGEIIGFKDTLTGLVITNSRANANTLKISGKGSDGDGGTFRKPLTDCTVPVKGTKTLSVFAPGAVAYRWTCDGEVVADVTGEELTVMYVRNKKVRTYSVTPIYSVYGVKSLGAASSCTVTNERLGMMVIID